MGDRRVRAQPRRPHPHLGFDLGPLRTKACLHRRARAVHGVVTALRARPIDQYAHLVARSSGRWRRSDVRDGPRPHRPGFPRSGPWQGDRGVERDCRRRRCDRATRRRGAHERRRLALDLHRQRAHRRRRDLAFLDEDAQSEGPRRDSPRRSRSRLFLGGDATARAGPHPGQLARMVERADCGDVLRLSGRLCRLRLHRTPPDPANV